MTPEQLDDLYYEMVFKEGTIEDLEDLKYALIKKGDWIFGCAVQGRIDELMTGK